MNFYRQHILFCTNQKKNDKKCCAQGNAEALAEHAKRKLKKLELHGEGKLRVSKTGCLGRCKQGPCLVVYDEQDEHWYHYKDIDDIDTIIDALINNQHVDRLLLSRS